jgi:Flp pilus assembly protein TadG
MFWVHRFVARKTHFCGRAELVVIMRTLRAFITNASGATAIEYGLIAALIAVV